MKPPLLVLMLASLGVHLGHLSSRSREPGGGALPSNALLEAFAGRLARRALAPLSVQGIGASR